jgi:hypothetical protein
MVFFDDFMLTCLQAKLKVSSDSVRRTDIAPSAGFRRAGMHAL